MTVSPNPSPKAASVSATARPGSRASTGHRDQPGDRERQADEGHRRSERTRTAKPGAERADGRRAGERAEGQPLLVGPAVEDAVDEDGAADDRGRERVAGQQRHERRRARTSGRRTAAGRGTGRATRSPRRTQTTVVTAAAASRNGGDPDRLDRAARRSIAPTSVSPTSPSSSARPNQSGAAHVEPPGSPRRVPAGRRRPAEEQGDQPDRDVEVEDPAPGRGEERVQRSGAGPRRPRRGPTPRIVAPRRTARRPCRGTSAPRRPRARAAGAGPSNRCAAAAVADRHEHAAAGGLDEPGGDELVHRLRRPGQRRADHEDRRAPAMNGRRAPHRSVIRPASGIVEDVHQQVAVDDPARLAELDPGGPLRRGRRGPRGSTAGRRP